MSSLQTESNHYSDSTEENKTVESNQSASDEDISQITEENSDASSFDLETDKGQTNQETNEKNEQEIYRLAGRKPLITICHLMIGPIISQVTGALYGIINSIWVSKNSEKEAFPP